MASTGHSAWPRPRRSGSAWSDAIVALVAAVAIKEIPLRTSNEQPVYGEAPAGASAATAPAAAASTSAASASKPAPSTD